MSEIRNAAGTCPVSDVTSSAQKQPGHGRGGSSALVTTRGSAVEPVVAVGPTTARSAAIASNLLETQGIAALVELIQVAGEPGASALCTSERNVSGLSLQSGVRAGGALMRHCAPHLAKLAMAAATAIVLAVSPAQGQTGASDDRV